MKLTVINDNTIYLLDIFLKSNIPKQFRYFKKRSISVIKNHHITIVGTICKKNKHIPISYCHIDKDDNTNWIGICVLEEYQKQGYGTTMLTYLIDYINKHNIQNVKLSVDIDNWKALKLYINHGFKIINVSNTHYILKLIKSPLLEVSLGESIDKLTILDIKKNKITDERYYFVEKEYNILFVELQKYISKHTYYYNILRDINKTIWDMQDEFRYSNIDTHKNKLCMNIINENDRRFRVKKKINQLCNSELKEQKGYIPTKAFVLSHLGLGDNITSIAAVRYLSTKYDEVYVVCKNKNKQNVELFYKDDTDIKIISVENDRNISPRLNIKEFLKLSENMDKYLCGVHLYKKRHCEFKKIPFNFYKDFNIKYDVFWKYFHVNIPNKSKELYAIIKEYKVLFIHNTSSTGNVFEVEDVLYKLNIISDEYLIINPDTNYYDITDSKYKIAEYFVYEPLAHYIDTIINSNYIVLCDSSFFCLSLQLPIKTNNCFYISRNNHTYDYLYEQEYGFSSTYKVQKFKMLS